MPIELSSTEGNLAVFRVSGKLERSSVDQAYRVCEEIIGLNGKVSILILIANFDGWENGEGWENTDFADKNDPYIDKIAMVGEEQWRDSALVFTLQGLRPVPIEYFGSGQESQARDWLGYSREKPVQA